MSCITKGAILTSAMALVVFCLASKPCFKNLPRNYNTLKYMAKKPRGLEVALVDLDLIGAIVYNENTISAIEILLT